jgi:hypothetical protein
MKLLISSVLVDPLSKAIGYRETLYLFFPGFVIASELKITFPPIFIPLSI